MSNLRFKHPSRVPVIVVSDNTTNGVKLKKNRFLVPKDEKFSTLIYAVRKHCLNLKTEQALFFMVSKTDNKSNAIIAPSCVTMDEIDRDFGNKSTGLLTVFVFKENTFGSDNSDSGSNRSSKMIPMKRRQLTNPSNAPLTVPNVEIQSIRIQKIPSLGVYYYFTAAIYMWEIIYSINNQTSIVKCEVDMNESHDIDFKAQSIIREREKLSGVAIWTHVSKRG